MRELYKLLGLLNIARSLRSPTAAGKAYLRRKAHKGLARGTRKAGL